MVWIKERGALNGRGKGLSGVDSAVEERGESVDHREKLWVMLSMVFLNLGSSLRRF